MDMSPSSCSYSGRESANCLKCGEERYKSRECNNESKCYCKERHWGNGKSCRKYAIEVGIVITAAKQKTTKDNATDIVLSRYPEDARLYSEATRQNARESNEEMNSQKDGEVIKIKSKREIGQAREQTKLFAEESVCASQVSDQVTRRAVEIASTSSENEERVSKISKDQKTEEKEWTVKSKKRQKENEQNPKEGTGKKTLTVRSLATM